MLSGHAKYLLSDKRISLTLSFCNNCAFSGWSTNSSPFTMRKILLLIIVASAVMTSCRPARIIYREASGRSVEPTQGAVFTPALIADLEIISDKSVSHKVTFTDVQVTTSILNEIDNYKRMALFQTSQKYNADVMVASVMNVNTNSRGQLEVTVVGYPARYVNFRQISDTDSIAMSYTSKVLSQYKVNVIDGTKELTVNSQNKKRNRRK